MDYDDEVVVGKKRSERRYQERNTKKIPLEAKKLLQVFIDLQNIDTSQVHLTGRLRRAFEEGKKRFKTTVGHLVAFLKLNSAMKFIAEFKRILAEKDLLIKERFV